MKRILPVRTKCDETTLYRPVLELFAKEQDYVFCEFPTLESALTLCCRVRRCALFMP